MDQWKAKLEANEKALKQALEEPTEDASSPQRNRYLITNRAGVSHARRILPPSRGVPGAKGYVSDADQLYDPTEAKIAREEWRKWVDEKQQLIHDHNVEKAKLLAELHVLRRAVDPKSRELLNEKETMVRLNAELEGYAVDSSIQLQNMQVKQLKYQ